MNRVELLDITPPATVKDAMEKEMKAEAKIVQAQAEAEASTARRCHQQAQGQ